MTTGFPEDSETAEPSDDNDAGHDDLQEELEGEFIPSPPPTATEDPDTKTVTGSSDGDELPTSPGVG